MLAKGSFQIALLPIVELVFVLFLASCSAQGTVRGEKPAWPPAPEKARVKYAYGVFAQHLGSGGGLMGRLGRLITGSDEELMRFPRAVEAQADGTFCVLDAGTKKILLFDHRGKFEKSIELPFVVSPIDIARAQGRTYITDSAAGVIYILDRRGRSMGRLGEGTFQRPTGICASPDGRFLYTVDTIGHCLFKLSTEGEVLSRIGGRGEEPGRFNFPTDVACTREGRIVVTDAMNFRIQIPSPEGRPLAAFGTAGDGPGTFARPKGVAVDSEGHIYVVDAMFDNVQVFARDGTLLLRFGRTGYGPGRFYMPTGISIDHEDRIYVADSYNRAVQVFQYIRGDER